MYKFLLSIHVHKDGIAGPCHKILPNSCKVIYITFSMIISGIQYLQQYLLLLLFLILALLVNVLTYFAIVFTYFMTNKVENTFIDVLAVGYHFL